MGVLLLSNWSVFLFSEESELILLIRSHNCFYFLIWKKGIDKALFTQCASYALRISDRAYGVIAFYAIEVIRELGLPGGGIELGVYSIFWGGDLGGVFL